MIKGFYVVCRYRQVIDIPQLSAIIKNNNPHYYFWGYDDFETACVAYNQFCREGIFDDCDYGIFTQINESWQKVYQN